MSSAEHTKWLSLDNLTNVCIVLTCIVVSGAFLQRWLVVPRQAGAPLLPTYEVGEHITPPTGVQFDVHANTVLLYLSSSCRFCTASMPFYAKLASARNEGDFEIVVVGSEPRESLTAYVLQHGLDAGGIVSVARGSFKSSGTPTVVIVDRSGRVQGAWTGLLGDQEREVRQRLGVGN